MFHKNFRLPGGDRNADNLSQEGMLSRYVSPVTSRVALFLPLTKLRENKGRYMVLQLTSINLLTLLATSKANFVLEISRRFAVKSLVWICDVCETDGN